MSELRYWVGLSLVPEIGPILSRRLIAACGSPSAIFRADRHELSRVAGLGQGKAAQITGFQGWDMVDRILTESDRNKIRVLPCDDPSFPPMLGEVDSAPIVLYIKGEYRSDDRYSIGIVGSRKHTDYGEAVTRKFSCELAAAGFTIVSGMARGIDTLAHKTALSSGGRTIAVLGCGPDMHYPPENGKLMDAITGSGAVFSEFPPGTMPLRENFPRRNRLISALSLGVLVVEATVSSGSLITANYALEQNREVFAVPGNITSENSGGTNRLIRQGAKAVLATNDIIEELAPQLKGFIHSGTKQAASLSEAESRLCRSLTHEPRHIDMIARETQLPVHTMLDLLLSLELKGVIRQSGGKRFYLS
ncbi:MAG: DNA-processing protein DprA [Nitrospiraceae bacterium]|nr:DNA-processing protein DprA [Nitrospiraceae bacterium]